MDGGGSNHGAANDGGNGSSTRDRNEEGSSSSPPKGGDAPGDDGEGEGGGKGGTSSASCSSFTNNNSEGDSATSGAGAVSNSAPGEAGGVELRDEHSALCTWHLPEFTKTRARQMWSKYYEVGGYECRLLVYPRWGCTYKLNGAVYKLNPSDLELERRMVSTLEALNVISWFQAFAFSSSTCTAYATGGLAGAARLRLRVLAGRVGTFHHRVISQ
jgi:hypothetical protein